MDYKKAFDSVARVHLWSKLLFYDINGKVLNIIKSLYNSAKSAVKLSTNIGAFFNCEIGVRQGDNLSPLLFALFFNDLQEFLAKAYNGLWSSFKLVENFVQDHDTVVYLKIFAILYADDTVFLPSPEMNCKQLYMVCFTTVIFGNWKLILRKQKWLFMEVMVEVMLQFSNLEINLYLSHVNIHIWVLICLAMVTWQKVLFLCTIRHPKPCLQCLQNLKS